MTTVAPVTGPAPVPSISLPPFRTFIIAALPWPRGIKPEGGPSPQFAGKRCVGMSGSPAGTGPTVVACSAQRNANPEFAMIDLYAMGSPNVVKIYIALEELRLPYTVHPVDVFGEAQFDPEFLKLNPNAKVPVIVDHEGPGVKPYTLFESGAMPAYWAEKTDRSLTKTTTA